MVLAALAMHPELRFLVERERDGDELVRVVAIAVVAGHYNARISNFHLGPITIGNGVDAEQTIAPIRGKNGEKFCEESRCRGGRRDSPREGQSGDAARKCWKKHGIRRDDSELHWEHLAIRGHPGRWYDLVPEGNDILHGLVIHQMRSTFNLDNGLVSANGVMAVLEVEAEGGIGSVLEEDIADGTVDDVIDGRSLHQHPKAQRCKRGEHG